MAKIKISELRPDGSELFDDSESYLKELGEEEITTVQGGILPSDNPLCTFSIKSYPTKHNTFPHPTPPEKI
jgi:hypothetical protein